MRHPMLRATIVVSALILLSACAQLKARQQREAAQQAAANTRSTCDAASGDPAIDPVRDKISIDVKDITLAMRTNPNYVTAEEKPALEAWLHARKVCNERFHGCLTIRS